MHASRRLAALAPSLLLSALASAAPPASPATRGAAALRLATCPGEAAEYLAHLDDRLVLDRAFFDETKTDDENIRLSVLQQLRYFWGYFRTHTETHAHQRVVLSAEDPEIEIQSKTIGSYGRDLTLDWGHTEPALQITDPYTARAVKRGYTKKADPAVIVVYQARFKLALCGARRGHESTLTVPLPSDPWLLYWHVPIAQHRPMRYFDEKAVTNPCIDNDFADLPHPFYYWYDWFHDRHGPDDAGRPFDCRKLLHAGDDFFVHDIRLSRIGSALPEFEALKQSLATAGEKPLSATVLIGALDHAWPDLKLSELASAIGQGTDPSALAERTGAILEKKEKRERGTDKFLTLLASLGRVIAVERFTSTLDGSHLLVEVTGRLRRSGRPIRVRHFLGLTDLFGPTPPGHWDILRRALAGDQVVIYAGHSGLGENFRLARIEDTLHLAHDAFSAAYRSAPFQLIAFLSCYSYMYFGQDLVAAGMDAQSPGKAFVYTGTEFTKGDQGALAILDLVDQILAPPSPAARAPELHFVEPGDFLILKEVRGNPDRASSSRTPK